MNTKSILAIQIAFLLSADAHASIAGNVNDG